MLRCSVCLMFVAILLASFISRLVADDNSGVKEGNKAPIFSWTDAKGKVISLETFKGKVVVVDCFTSFLGPQVAAMPWETLKESDLVVLAVGNEDEEDAKSRKEKGRTYIVVADPEHKISNQYSPIATPSCYVVGRDGTVKFAATGYGGEVFDAMHSAVTAELAKK